MDNLRRSLPVVENARQLLGAFMENGPTRRIAFRPPNSGIDGGKYLVIPGVSRSAPGSISRLSHFWNVQPVRVPRAL